MGQLVYAFLINLCIFELFINVKYFCLITNVCPIQINPASCNLIRAKLYADLNRIFQVVMIGLRECLNLLLPKCMLGASLTVIGLTNRILLGITN